MSTNKVSIKTALQSNKPQAKPTNIGIPRNAGSTTMMINESNKVTEKKIKKMSSNNDLNFNIKPPKSESMEKTENSNNTQSTPIMNDNMKKNMDPKLLKNKYELLNKKSNINNATSSSKSNLFFLNNEDNKKSMILF